MFKINVYNSAICTLPFFKEINTFTFVHQPICGCLCVLPLQTVIPMSTKISSHVCSTLSFTESRY